MATKKEKLFGSTLGIGFGFCITPAGEGSEIDWFFRLRNAAIGGLIGYGASLILGEASDTVNYELFLDRKRVYHGISYKDRIEKRFAEHKKGGKVFTKVKYDDPKPRSEAMTLERELIQRDRPIYNIQHNS